MQTRRRSQRRGEATEVPKEGGSEDERGKESNKKGSSSSSAASTKQQQRRPSVLPPRKRKREAEEEEEGEEEEGVEVVNNNNKNKGKEGASLPFKNLAHSKIDTSGKRKNTKNLKQILKAENFSALPPGTPHYMSIQAPPSLLPTKKYCDITGFEAPYTDPNTRLRYSSSDIYQFIRTLSHGAAQEYLALRNAHSKLK